MKLKEFTADNIMQKTRIRPWERTAAPKSIWEYLGIQLKEEQKQKIHFAPKVEVPTFQNPKTKESYEGWRTTGGDWATVFALLPNNLVVTAIEYKHGVEEVIIGLPAGVAKSGENMEEVVRRELLEETGFMAKKIIPLGDPQKGIAVSTRKATTCCFGFLAYDAKKVKEPELDEDEDIEVGLVKLDQWLSMIERGIVRDASAVTTTFLALHALKKL